MTEFTQEELDAALERYYPHWWMHRTTTMDAVDRPEYLVVVGDERERALALAAKPAYVDAAVSLA